MRRITEIKEYSCIFLRKRDKYNNPIVAVVEDDNGFLYFWCPFCKKVHQHGVGGGVRASHCFNEKSPLFRRDYHLIVNRIRRHDFVEEDS